MPIIKFDVTDRFSGAIKFTAEIQCSHNASHSAKLGLAVKWAVKNNADLRWANLSWANLSEADLRWANLREADLSGADLSWANLREANLSWANLSGANLSWANLSEANLSGADLSWANLREANLSGANLSGANLREANLSGANLSGAKGAGLAIARTRILPEGDLIGWKKCHGGILVRLKIPSEAKRSHAFGRKCRAEFADVLEIIGGISATSNYDDSFVYRVGDRATCHEWDDDWKNEFAGGIHFYITREEAEAHI